MQFTETGLNGDSLIDLEPCATMFADFFAREFTEHGLETYLVRVLQRGLSQ